MALGLPCPALALGLLALLLLPGTRSDCGSLPGLSRAAPRDTNILEGFPVGREVTYKCLDGFVKIPGKRDTVVCLSHSEWSPLEEFCGRSCDVPVRLKVAALNQEDEMKSYYPVGITVRYTCRPGYEITEMPLVSTCLENLTWSEVPQFCSRKSCGHPGELLHGRAVTETDFLFGGKVDFLCEDGYELIGQPSIQCRLNGDEVEWSERPTCRKRIQVRLEEKAGSGNLTEIIQVRLEGKAGSGNLTGFNTTSISVVPEQHPKKDIRKPYKPSQFQNTPFTITFRRSFPRGGLRTTGRWVTPPLFRFAPLYVNENYCSVRTKGRSVCHQRYMGISGILPSTSCFKYLKWPEVPMFCGKRSWRSRRTRAWQSCCYNRLPIRCKRAFHP